jgi:hypothetical protein
MLSNLNCNLQSTKISWNNCEICNNTRIRIESELIKIAEQHHLVIENKTTTNLISLNGGNIKFSKPTEGYVNHTEMR